MNVRRALPVLLLVVAALVSPTTGGIARADGPEDPPALISVEEATSPGLAAEIVAFNQDVAAQQSTEQSLSAEQASLEAQIAPINAALNADDAAGDATDQEFTELNSEIQAYNDAGPPGDPAVAAELNARGEALAAQQDQNNAKVDADNAAHDRLMAAIVAHNNKDTDYDDTNQQLTVERAALLVQILGQQVAAALPVIATPTSVDSLRGMDSPQPDQEYPADGGDSTAPVTPLQNGGGGGDGGGPSSNSDVGKQAQDLVDEHDDGNGNPRLTLANAYRCLEYGPAGTSARVMPSENMIQNVKGAKNPDLEYVDQQGTIQGYGDVKTIGTSSQKTFTDQLKSGVAPLRWREGTLGSEYNVIFIQVPDLTGPAEVRQWVRSWQDSRPGGIGSVSGFTLHVFTVDGTSLGDFDLGTQVGT
jgi:hypothetical protein